MSAAEIEKPLRIVVASDQAIFRLGLATLVNSIKRIQLVGEAQDRIETLQLIELVKPDIILCHLRETEAPNNLVIHTILEQRSDVLIFLFTQQKGPEISGVRYLTPNISETDLVAILTHAGQQRRNSLALASTPKAHPLHEEGLEITPPAVTKVGQAQVRDGELLTRELVMAGKIQTDILPERAPLIPGWDFAARLEPARETSGDFYDFIPLANHNWGIVIADVTDKGMGAALFMALSSTLIRTYAARYPTLPALAMDVVNERILSDTRGNMFITAFYGVLEPHIGRLRFVNAGHPPGFLVSTQKGKPLDRLSTTGMALGVMENAHWQQKVSRLSSSDLLVLYTDGITEAQNPQGIFYGEQRLQEVIRRAKPGCPAQELLETILDEVHSFVGEMPRQDDIALIVIRRK